MELNKTAQECSALQSTNAALTNRVTQFQEAWQAQNVKIQRLFEEIQRNQNVITRYKLALAATGVEPLTPPNTNFFK